MPSFDEKFIITLTAFTGSLNCNPSHPSPYDFPPSPLQLITQDVPHRYSSIRRHRALGSPSRCPEVGRKEIGIPPDSSLVRAPSYRLGRCPQLLCRRWSAEGGGLRTHQAASVYL